VQLLLLNIKFRPLVIDSTNLRWQCLRDITETPFVVHLFLAEIHPLPPPPPGKSPSSAKFGRDSSSRHQQASTGYDSAPSDSAPHRYVTSRDETTHIETSSSTSRHSRSALAATTTFVLLLQTTACRRFAPK